MSAAPTHAARRSPAAGDVDGPRRSLLAARRRPDGIGVAGFIDETVFHQLLHWHHFYDKSTPSWGLISDGLFHAASWFCMIAGLFVFADLRRRGAWRATWRGRQPGSASDSAAFSSTTARSSTSGGTCTKSATTSPCSVPSV